MPSHAHCQDILVDRASGVLIAENSAPLAVSVDAGESPAVMRAASGLISDLHHLVGAETSLVHDAPARIVVGTIGVSAVVDAAISDGRLDVSGLRDDAGNLRWEGFTVALVDDVLHLVGADRRGTVYAVYEFARAAGVSPWQWWGDTPVHPRTHLTVARAAQIVDWPSVRYRGVFLNDEEELYHWARRHTRDDTIGPEVYERLYELILRLGGNYLWPAMHVGAFNHDPHNGHLAHEMGIVIGSSHCDILLRSNNHEFHPWSRSRPEPVRYDYSIGGANRDALRSYWRESVEQNRAYDVTWTVGIRGVHDSGFETKTIDEDDALDGDAKFRARVALLEQAVRDQRGILSDVLDVEPDRPPQLFIPYKEVLPLYDAGLRVPDDVTLVWANDNFGYIRRLPSDIERERAGGHGLYYHSSYWSNFTTSYLGTSSTPLALMRAELTKAWDGGIRRLWVDNVGGLKPLEIETEFFLRSAWQAGRETTTANVRDFVAGWVNATFSGSLGERASDIYARYYQLNNQRKYEHLSPDVFSQTSHGDEAGRRLAALRDLFDETNALMAALPEVERDSFFQLFAIKIYMSYLVNAEFYYSDRSTLAHDQGKFAAANMHLATSRALGDRRRLVIHFFNKVMSGGKWDGMFTPESFPPPVIPLHPPGTPALRIEGKGIGATVWGAASQGGRKVVFTPHGRADKWIEVFSTGQPGMHFTVESDPWIEVRPRTGVIDGERRLMVRLRAPADTLAGCSGRIRVSSPDTDEIIDFTVNVDNAPFIRQEVPGWIEADAVVSIDASAPDEVISGGDMAFTIVPDLGRYGNGLLQVRPLGEGSQSEPAAAATFGVHLSTPGSHVLEIHRFPSLNSTGRIRLGVNLDGGTMLVVESPTTDEHRGTWATGVQDNVDKLRVQLPYLTAGHHTLTLHAVDPWFALSKIVIYTAEHPVMNLGPDFSAHTLRATTFVSDPDPGDLDLPALDAAFQEVFGDSPGETTLPDTLYADRHFWTGDTTNRMAIVVAQLEPRSKAHDASRDYAKELMASAGHFPLAERNGVVAFEAEDALAGTEHAWLTAANDGTSLWAQTQAETRARTGLAMHVRPRGVRWEDPLLAPAMHYTIEVSIGGPYRVWLLLSFQDDSDDSCTIALDGVPQPVDEQFSHGALCTYGARQVWLWAHLSDLEIGKGRHTLSIHARESGLRIDRIYLTLGDELPPGDAQWQPSVRTPVDMEEFASAPSA